jgi:hypothetical protein
MRSPQVSTAIVAAVFAAIAYIITNFIISSSMAVTSQVLIIAAMVFITTFIAPLLNVTSTANVEEASDDDVKTLYVGNLPYRANEAAVNELFSNYGNVQSVRLMKDKHTGKRRGFGFVEMAANDIEKAISALNDTEFQQRTLKVREAKERPERTDNENS